MKRKTGLIILLAVVVLLLAFVMIRAAVNRNLGKKVENVRNSFTAGVLNTDGTTTQSVADALHQRLAAADTLQTVAAKYDAVYSEYTVMRNASNALLTLLKNGGSMAELKEANEAMNDCFRSCAAALESLVEGKSAAQLAEAEAAFTEAQSAVDAAAEAYNANIAAFTRNTLNKFPNSLLKGLVKGGMPEKWPG